MPDLLFTKRDKLRHFGLLGILGTPASGTLCECVCVCLWVYVCKCACVCVSPLNLNLSNCQDAGVSCGCTTQALFNTQTEQLHSALT